MPDLKWEEVKGIMAEVQDLFAGREDVGTVEEVLRLQSEIRDGLATKQQHAQAIIRALTAEVEETQARVATLPANREEEESRRQAAEQQRSATHEQVAALQQKAQDTQTTIDAIEQQMKEVEEEATSADGHQGPHANPSQQGHERLRHAISLYHNITGVQWKYEDDKPHLLQGYAAIPSVSEVQSFCLDCTRESKFAIANKLWDIIDPPAAPESPSIITSPSAMV